MLCVVVMQYSRKSGSNAPTKWSEEEIEIALEGECYANGCSSSVIRSVTSISVLTYFVRCLFLSCQDIIVVVVVFTTQD